MWMLERPSPPPASAALPHRPKTMRLGFRSCLRLPVRLIGPRCTPSHQHEPSMQPGGNRAFPRGQSIRIRDRAAQVAERLVDLARRLGLFRPLALSRLRLLVRSRTARSEERLQLQVQFAFGTSVCIEHVNLSQSHYKRFAESAEASVSLQSRCRGSNIAARDEVAEIVKGAP